MKHFYLLRSGAKALCLLALVALATTTAKAELLLNEDFDYTVTTLADQDEWYTFGTNSAAPISLVASPLTYAGYQDAAKGKAVKLDSVKSGQDLYRVLSKVQPYVAGNSVYYSALINLTYAPTEAPNLFISFGYSLSAGTAWADAKTPTLFAQLYAQQSSEGKYKLGIGRNNCTTNTFTTKEFEYGTTYLVVVKYTFVEGVTNDIVSVFVNPTNSEPTTADCTYDGTTGSDISSTDNTRGIAVITIQQSTTFSRKASVLILDAIRVATTWADLFPASSGEGDGGETTKTPEITSSKDLLFGGNAFLDETYTATFTVSGKNLKGDITLESDNPEVTLSHSTIAQVDAEAEGGVTVTATLKPVTTGAKGSAGITLKSDGASDVVVAASWAVVERTKVATIAELKEAEKTASTSDYLFFTGEAVVTYAEKPRSTQFYYIEDATGAVRLDEINAVAIESGDKIKDFTISMNEDQTHSFYILADPTIVSKNNELTPQVVTLKALTDNGADYFWELVKVEGVTLDKNVAQYIAGQNKISQDETTINLNLTSDNTLVGTDKPTKADVVGISYYDTGLVIRARSAADVTAKPEGTTTAIATAQNGEMLCYSADGMLHIDNATNNVAIYSLTGICVARLNAAEHIAISLPQGIYAVKANGATTKVVVK